MTRRTCSSVQHHSTNGIQEKFSTNLANTQEIVIDRQEASSAYETRVSLASHRRLQGGDYSDEATASRSSACLRCQSNGRAEEEIAEPPVHMRQPPCLYAAELNKQK